MLRPGSRGWAPPTGLPSFPATTMPTYANRGRRRLPNGRRTCGATMPAKARMSEDAFPSLRIRRHVALIGLSSAQPSAPFLATGRLGEGQLQRLDRILEQTADAGLFRIVMLHHPPAAHTVRWRKSLRDGATLRAMLKRHEVELVLHGHAHFSAATYLDPGLGRNLAIGVPVGIGDREKGRSACDLPCLSHCPRQWRLASARLGAGILAGAQAFRSRGRPAVAPGAGSGAGRGKSVTTSPPPSALPSPIRRPGT